MKKYFWGRPINVFFKENLYRKLSEIAAIVLILPEKNLDSWFRNQIHISHLSKILKAFC